ncbi:FtsX-like permease family protein [Oceanirhabdus seepicola]|uniref:ABC transporter permease n=1 Tax=Oceanirhabdus seepicola TaxID=2828781 RepID=A0A9J6P6L1_9CLOT|nr:ABC transporter permease [Oceanirhabdus seepicola]MCM1992227.1 ABC transporter permease [Oceanirhabdus seepicola]
MYSKIAINNIKKSFKDYAIYFMTLTLAVSIFYNFNSISSQTAMNDINKIGVLVKLISYISVFMSIVFGGLIIYANNALLKKRKKEFGIYAILGMSKRKISQILIYETFIVGIISLVMGLIIGIVLSQGISVLTAKLFELNMNEYTFNLSIESVNKTFLYFAIMFILVMIFNTVIVSKQKLIDMINASRKNESIKSRNTIISAIIFIISLYALGKAYYLGLHFAHTPQNIDFPLSIIWGSLGTLLFFFGLSGFTVLILRRSEQIYFKKLNIFVIKQFYNKINTNFLSMTATCLMLFLTIVILSTSLSTKHILEKRLEDLPIYDGSIDLSISDENQEVQDVKEALKRVGFKLSNSYEDAVIDYYRTDIKKLNLLNEYASLALKERFKEFDSRLGSIKISQYNELRRLRGEAIVDLKENEILLITCDEEEQEALQKLIEKQNEIKISGKKYTIKTNINIKHENSYLLAVIPDSFLGSMMKSSSTMYIFNTSGQNKEELEDKVKELQAKFADISYNRDKLLDKYGFILRADTKVGIYNQVKSNIGTTIYIAIYLGFVFLIASAVMLAIQQLTEASDSLNRYKTLKKIGASEQMINKSIFTQILIHFMTPLSLALIHSVIGLKIMNTLSKSAGLLITFEFGPTIIITGVVIFMIYGGYFYTTYLGYKNIVKND